MLNRFLTGHNSGLLFPIAFFTILTSFFFTIGCAPKLTPAEYKGEQLHFGQGGGFTGDVNYFILLDDGRVFKKEVRDSSYILYDTWKKTFVDQMFSNYQSLALEKTEFYHPGNLYYFIEKHSRNVPVHRISWGQSGYTPEPNIVSFYNLLYKSTKQKS